MSLLSSKLRKWADEGTGCEGLTYWCQGCNQAHGIVTKGDKAWRWNGDVNAPVFTPSVLYDDELWTPPVTAQNIEEWRRAPWEQHKVRHVCHTFVGCNGAQPGEVIFLRDSTHALAGTVQPFPDLPDYMRSDS